jgi:hypothetical protein
MTHENMINHFKGLGDEPMFASEVVGADVRWGKGTPPGGAGSCLVRFEGSFYNGSCEQSAHFACQENPDTAKDKLVSA